jgi:hypothetical protein
MALAADRMKAMCERRRARGLRELRLIVPDARSKTQYPAGVQSMTGSCASITFGVERGL